MEAHTILTHIFAPFFVCVTKKIFIHGVVNPLLCCEVFIFITYLHYIPSLFYASDSSPSLVWSVPTATGNNYFQHVHTEQWNRCASAIGWGKQRLLFSSVLCFTETWLCEPVPDSGLQLPGFQLFRADWVTERTTSWSCQAKQKVNASVFTSTIADVLMWQCSCNTVLRPGIICHKL